jgi:fructoselysine 6-kinase
MAVAQPRVAAVGDNCIDVYTDLAQSAVGGNALNVAVHLRRLGSESEYLGAVGADDDGRRVLRALEGQGVRHQRVQIEAGQTAISELALDARGERIVVSERFGVCAGYAPEADDIEYVRSFDHVHCANLTWFSAVAEALMARSVSFSFDFAVTLSSTHFRGLEIAFLGSEVPPEDGRTAALARAAVSRGARLAVVTCGPYGSLAFDGERIVTTAPASSKIVDTCGAGDSYIAAFIYSKLGGATLRECMRAGAEAAAETCRHLAAWPQTLERLREVSA